MHISLPTDTLDFHHIYDHNEILYVGPVYTVIWMLMNFIEQQLGLERDEHYSCPGLVLDAIPGTP